jgi:surface carbohydrate biosynthesis protein
LEYLQPWEPEVLHVRGEQINMRVLMASIFGSGKIFDAYVDCFIERVRPRLIVTFIDNSVSFLSISRRHPGVKTAFVQNGWRGEELFEFLDKMEPRRRDTLKVDYMFSFGPVPGANYARYITGTVVPMGSAKNNRAPRTRPLQKGSIAFVSQWEMDGIYVKGAFCSHEAFFENVDGPILRCLRDYADSRNKRLLIIPRYPKHGELRAREEAYFRQLLGQESEFSEPPGLYPSYQAVDAAEVVVVVTSTLGYESIARGNKTAIFSVRGNMLGIPGWAYGWPGNFPADGPFWTNRPTPEAYVRILDYLFEVDDAQWQRDVQATDFASLMVYDPGNTMLKSILEKELGQPPAHRGDPQAALCPR